MPISVSSGSYRWFGVQCANQRIETYLSYYGYGVAPASGYIHGKVYVYYRDDTFKEWAVQVSDAVVQPGQTTGESQLNDVYLPYDRTFDIRILIVGNDEGSIGNIWYDSGWLDNIIVSAESFGYGCGYWLPKIYRTINLSGDIDPAQPIIKSPGDTVTVSMKLNNDYDGSRVWTIGYNMEGGFTVIGDKYTFVSLGHDTGENFAEFSFVAPDVYSTSTARLIVYYAMGKVNYPGLLPSFIKTDQYLTVTP